MEAGLVLKGTPPEVLHRVAWEIPVLSLLEERWLR